MLEFLLIYTRSKQIQNLYILILQLFLLLRNIISLIKICILGSIIFVLFDVFLVKIL